MSAIKLRILSTGLSTGATLKNAALTLTEVDQNFNNLNADKLEKSSNLSDLTDFAVARSNLGVNNASYLSTGTISSNVLGNSSLFIGTTQVALNRASANLELTGISSISLPGSSSGTAKLVASANAGANTTVTIPSISGTMYVTGGTDVALSDGGTGASLSAVQGGIVYSGSSAFAITAAGTSGQLLRSNGTGAPSWQDPQSNVSVAASTVNSNLYLLLATGTGTIATANIVDGANLLAYNPSTGTLTAKNLSGDGSLLTGVDRFPSQTGNTGRYLTTNGTTTSWAPVSGVYNFTVKTANYTAVSFDYIFADTTSAGFTVTLPASPPEGAVVVLYDYNQTFAVNNLVVNRNGSTIGGVASNLVLNSPNTETTLIYQGSTWRIYSVIKQRQISTGPVLVGPTLGFEFETALIRITNYNATTGSYSISTTGGSTTRVRDVIYWTLPSVTASTNATITVTYNTGSGTTINTLTLQVLNSTLTTDTGSQVVVTNYSLNTFISGWSVY